MRAIAVVAALFVTLEAAQTDTFADVMRRAHEYVVVYEDHELSSVIASEHYQQQLDRIGAPPMERVLRSDYLIFQLPPQEDWFALRDVYEVDGMPVGDRAARLRELFAGPRGTVTDRAMQIAAENARFNLGDIYRTVNVPTYALRILRPISRGRMRRFQKAGEEEIDSTRTWVVNYEEIKGPTFSATRGGRDIPARGRFWIEPETGVVVRSEMILGGTRQLRERATITVTYRLEPLVGFRVPVEMRERYDTPTRKDAEVIVAVATYSGFRRFDLRTLTQPNPQADEPGSNAPPAGGDANQAFAAPLRQDGGGSR